jgi:hypothetical protein
VAYLLLYRQPPATDSNTQTLERDRAVAETTYRLRTVQKQHPDYIQDDNVS